MGELLFPVAALAATFLLIMPSLTWLSRALLARKRRRARSWAEFGGESTFAWLAAPTVLPLSWLASSALHQSEPSQSLKSCLIDHVEATSCLDAVALLGLLVVGMVVAVARCVWREGPRLRVDAVGEGHPQAARVARVVSSDARLRGMSVVVARQAPTPVYVSGWLRPRGVVDACFARDADDAMLRAALLHERAHAAAYDTLRVFLIRLCLFINPAGGWLAADFGRWRQAREAQCDGEAIHHGGDALALAEGIVRAARFRCDGVVSCGIAMLGGQDLPALRLRLALLQHGPPRSARTLGHAALVVAVVIALVVPHVQEVGALDHFHLQVERLLHWLQ